jgi:hypothetical protein
LTTLLTVDNVDDLLQASSESQLLLQTSIRDQNSVEATESANDRETNPFAKDYSSEILFPDTLRYKASERDVLWTSLSYLSVAELRKSGVQSAFKIPQSRNKQILMCLVLLRASDAARRRSNMTVLQAVNETNQNSSSCVREFLENEENKKRAWMSAPSDNSILGNLPPGVIGFLCLPRASNDGVISQDGKSILLLFVALKVGSLEEDTELLNYTCREAQLDIVTEEPGTAGGEGLVLLPESEEESTT